MDMDAEKVFIGGSRRLTRLNDDIISHLNRITKKGLAILIGDANGVDKAVQSYLCEHEYDNVTVFHSGEKCRNNVGNWHAVQVEPPTKRRDYNYYAAKDKRMADEADYGLVIWDGKSRGTRHQIQRLLSQEKKVFVYDTKLKRFVNAADLKSLKCTSSKGNSKGERSAATTIGAAAVNKSSEDIEQLDLL